MVEDRFARLDQSPIAMMEGPRSNIELSFKTNPDTLSTEGRLQVKTLKIVLLAVAATLAAPACAPALAQQKFIYPAKGQTPEQQQKDEFECYQWAVQQTGYDPTKGPPPQAAAPQPSQPAGAAPGSGAQGALRGAAVGGLIGGIGGRGGEGAAAGAVVGGMAARRASRERQQMQQAQQQQQAAQQQAAANAAGPDAYNRARTACLSGRGYTVN